MPELTPEIQELLNMLANHVNNCIWTGEKPCPFEDHCVSNLKRLGYTYSLTEIGQGEVL